jgi:hypothetical protein
LSSLLLYTLLEFIIQIYVSTRYINSREQIFVFLVGGWVGVTFGNWRSCSCEAVDVRVWQGLNSIVILGKGTTLLTALLLGSD